MHYTDDMTPCELRLEIQRLHKFIMSASDRIAACSEILGHLAQKRRTFTVSGPKSTIEQGFLWDLPITSHGQVRNVVGDLAERLTARLVAGVRHKTDCRSGYCPDVSVPGTNRYYESKAVGKSRQAFVYAGRVVKDRAFVRAGNKLRYVIWHHGIEAAKASSVMELRLQLLAGMRAVYEVPFECMDSMLAGQTPEKLNSKYGGADRADRKCYGSGYRIPLSDLEVYKILDLPNGVSEDMTWS